MAEIYLLEAPSFRDNKIWLQTKDVDHDGKVEKLLNQWLSNQDICGFQLTKELSDKKVKVYSNSTNTTRIQLQRINKNQDHDEHWITNISKRSSSECQPYLIGDM